MAHHGNTDFHDHSLKKYTGGAARVGLSLVFILLILRGGDASDAVVAVGFVVGFIAVSMVLPMYSILSEIK